MKMYNFSFKRHIFRGKEIHKNMMRIILHCYHNNMTTHFINEMAQSPAVEQWVLRRQEDMPYGTHENEVTWLIELLFFHPGGLRIPRIENAGNPDFTWGIYERLWLHSGLKSRSSLQSVRLIIERQRHSLVVGFHFQHGNSYLSFQVDSINSTTIYTRAHNDPSRRRHLCFRVNMSDLVGAALPFFNKKRAAHKEERGDRLSFHVQSYYIYKCTILWLQWITWFFVYACAATAVLVMEANSSTWRLCPQGKSSVLVKEE